MVYFKIGDDHYAFDTMADALAWLNETFSLTEIEVDHAIGRLRALGIDARPIWVKHPGKDSTLS